MSLYTDERNAQILISLLKEHNIRKVVASPGTTNACFVSSLQSDGYFEIYSAPEERSGAYIACGLAAESGEPVVLSCTGATASRNYMPALTEAYYRKLPILAVTSSRRNAYIGHNLDQVTDRTQLPNDVAKISVQMPVVHDEVSEWECVIAANKAVLELWHHGGGPVHINLETTYSQKSVPEIAPVRAIYRHTTKETYPKICDDRVAVIVGAHLRWSEALTKAVDDFCRMYNGVVLCDHTSNYKGEYRIFANLLADQRYWKSTIKSVNTVIHIGDVSSSEYGINMGQVWRVNPDGELRDPYRKLRHVFECEEEEFFSAYVSMANKVENKSFFEECKKEENELLEAIPDLPFSNLWAASVTAKALPQNSVLHLGIRNSLRTWNFFDADQTVLGYSNTGGFGIDGSISTVVGAALAHPEKLYYCVLGDLAFFYDINVLGNRHFPHNVRILLVNNGLGMEMKFPFAWGCQIASAMEVNEDEYITASGHFTQRTNPAVKHFAEDFGCEYISAFSKEEYIQRLSHFVDPSLTGKSIVFEIFVDPQDEGEAISLIGALKEGKAQAAKNAIKGVIGDKGVKAIKSTLKKFEKN